jgi:hypothetical protein
MQAPDPFTPDTDDDDMTAPEVGPPPGVVEAIAGAEAVYVAGDAAPELLQLAEQLAPPDD